MITFGWRGMFWTTALLSLVFFGLFYGFYRNPSQDKRLSHAEAEYIREGGGEPETSSGGATGRERRIPHRAAETVGPHDRLHRVRLPVRLPADVAARLSHGDVPHQHPQSGRLRVRYLDGVGTIADLVVGGWLVDYLIKRGADANRVRKTLLIAGLVLGFAVIGAVYTKNINVAVFWIALAAAGISFHAPVAWSIPGLIAPRN